MVLLAIGSALIGAVFGLRFKVLVLVPAILVGLFGIVVAGAANGAGISTIVIDAIVLSCALQFGYLSGLFTRFVMVAARTRLVPPSNSLARASH